MTIHASLRAQLRFGVQLEKTQCCCLKKLLNGMVFQNRSSLIREPSLSLREVKHQSLIGTASELGIEHITASVRRPTTCGKIEAFHKAYEVESHLFKVHWSFIRYYNYTRPHEGINYLTPAEIYLKDKSVSLFLDRTTVLIKRKSF